MINTNKRLFIFFLIIFANSILFSAPFFSGMTGVKLNYHGNTEIIENKSTYKPYLSLQAFFAGQFNFSEKVWGRTEFSLEISDLLNNHIVSNGSPSTFRIEELSLVLKGETLPLTNYLSIFLGNYEGIGSDIFLRKYFGIESISSKLITSYLGLSGSKILKQNGLGIGDVLVLKNSPIAYGFYTYINYESSDDSLSLSFLLNTDFRFAISLQYFTLDILAGLGIPLKTPENNYLIAVQTAYWHAGTNILIGNNYTQSLFIQLGLFNVAFNREQINPLNEKFYLLFEPRFNIGKCNLDFTLYTFPKEMQKKLNDLPFLSGTFGGNINIYIESIRLGKNLFTIGLNSNISYSNTNINDILNNTHREDKLNVTLGAYTSTKFLIGELSCIIKINCTEFSKNSGNVFSADLGFKAKF